MKMFVTKTNSWFRPFVCNWHPFCPQIYALSAAFLLPDVIFYTKLVVELVDWGAERPAWAKSDWSCGLWQVFVALNMVYMGQAAWYDKPKLRDSAVLVCLWKGIKISAVFPYKPYCV